VDPNRLCSDPDPEPGSHFHRDLDLAPESEQDPNKFGSGSDINLSNFLKNQSFNQCWGSESKSKSNGSECFEGSESDQTIWIWIWIRKNLKVNFI